MKHADTGPALHLPPKASGVGGSTFVYGKPRPAHLTSPNASMTSQEIVDLVGARHDSVKRTIERLAERGVIEFPPTEEISTATKPVTVYRFAGEQGKRDSIVIVVSAIPRVHC